MAEEAKEDYEREVERVKEEQRKKEEREKRQEKKCQEGLSKDADRRNGRTG